MISYVAAGALSAILGLLSGQGLVLAAGRRRLAARAQALELQHSALVQQVEQLSEALPQLISRSEVERAFAQAAQIEAQRQAAAQQLQQRAATGLRQSAAAPPDLNTAINGQLQALEERIARINQEFGLG